MYQEKKKKFGDYLGAPSVAPKILFDTVQFVNPIINYFFDKHEQKIVQSINKMDITLRVREVLISVFYMQDETIYNPSGCFISFVHAGSKFFSVELLIKFCLCKMKILISEVVA